MNDEQKQNAAVLFGGENVALSGGGEIFVRALPVRAFNIFASALDDEPRLVGLFSGLDAEDVDKLPVEDFENILARGLDINLAPFSRWLERRRKTAVLLGQIAGGSVPAATAGGNGANTSQNL